MVTDSELEEGQRVYDAETPVFDVVSVLDSVASEVVAREEVTDRGHTIYSEMTVADLYPSYPEDDRVVKVMNVAMVMNLCGRLVGLRQGLRILLNSKHLPVDSYICMLLV